MVAATELKPGDNLGPKMLTWQDWPQKAVRPEHLVEGVADSGALAGAMVRVSVAKGEPLLLAHLVKRGDQGIMAALIAPGLRAVTIAVTASSGLAGFVGPGDRVDILLTASVPGSNPGSGGNRIVGQTVVEGVRVLGIDQRVEPVSAAALQDEARFAPPTTVTLEVTPKQAETIAVAQEIGKLTLSLRDLQAQRRESAPTGAVVVEAAGKTWDTDVTRLPAGAFEATAAGLSLAAAAAVSPVPSLSAAPGLVAAAASPMESPSASGAADPMDQSAGTRVERVNGVEIVRGSSNRAAAAPAAPANASAQGAAQ